MNVEALFSVTPSGVGPNGVPAVPDPTTWYGNMLGLAGTLQLPTTSWQSGQPERTIFAIEAVQFNLADVDVALMAQGGFLQSAASGTVTYTAVNGDQITIAVTPDPSDVSVNATGELGWLDALAENVYATPRLPATAAAGPLAIVKVTAGSAGPYVAGAYHVTNTTTGATYTNTETVTIPSGIIGASGGVITSIVPGFTSTTITTVAPHGRAAGDSVYLVVPTTSGINGLNGVFATVTTAGTSTLTLGIGSSGTYVSGGNMYACTIANMKADLVGPVASAGPGQVNSAITQNASVFVSNIIAWSGANWENNIALRDRCVLALAARSPNGPSQAYTYIAETAVALLAARTPPYVLTNGPVKAETHNVPKTGIVNVVVASLTPASTVLNAHVTPGIAQMPISSVINDNPTTIVTSGPTTLAVGQSMTVTISGALGLTLVNGTFTGTSDGTTNGFTIPIDTTLSPAYTGGGTVEGGDLGQIDTLIQELVVPTNTTAVTTSAYALPILVVASVVVPKAYVQTYTARVQAQLDAQIKSYSIGGDAPDFNVGYEDIVGALEAAGVQVLGQASYVREIQSLSINGGGVGVGVTFPSPYYQAILVPPVISVVGI